MKNILILFAIIFSIIIVHYYITRQVESFFNFSNDSWNENNIEGFFANSNEQIVNPALIKRKKKIDTELLPIESAKMDYYQSFKHPYGIVNNTKKKIKNCEELTKHRGEKWDSSYSYQDSTCCNTKLNMCCCLGEECGNIKKCNDLINMKENDDCDLNKDNNCIKPILNNYTMKSRDIWGKHNLKWDYKGVDQDLGAIQNEKNF